MADDNGPVSFLGHGLHLAKLNNGCSENIRLRRFKCFYGALPTSCMQIWEDLKNKLDIEHRLPPNANLDHFFMALRFLRLYEEMSVIAGIFGLNEKTAGKWTWYYVERISLLKSLKVSGILSGTSPTTRKQLARNLFV